MKTKITQTISLLICCILCFTSVSFASPFSISTSKTTYTTNDKEDTIVLSNGYTFSDVNLSSSNLNVISVFPSGQLRIRGAGTATITAVAKNGSGSSSITLTVIQPVTGISLNRTSISLKVDEALVITANVFPNNATNKKVSWSSSNNSVATVSANGFVKGINSGSCTITCTSLDSGISSYCSVTVSGTPKPSTTNKKENNNDNTQNKDSEITTSSTTIEPFSNTEILEEEIIEEAAQKQEEDFNSETNILPSNDYIVENLVVTTEKDKITFNWDKNENVSGYELYIMDKNNKYFLVYKGNDNSFVQYNFLYEHNYKVSIRTYIEQDDTLVYSKMAKGQNFMTPKQPFLQTIKDVLYKMFT